MAVERKGGSRAGWRGAEHCFAAPTRLAAVFDGLGPNTIPSGAAAAPVDAAPTLQAQKRLAFRSKQSIGINAAWIE
jgi:hypothetical protein